MNCFALLGEIYISLHEMEDLEALGRRFIDVLPFVTKLHGSDTSPSGVAVDRCRSDDNASCENMNNGQNSLNKDRQLSQSLWAIDELAMLSNEELQNVTQLIKRAWALSESQRLASEQTLRTMLTSTKSVRASILSR
jgi:hypothetical protein